jgi:IMP dehydrogenase
MHRKVSEVMTKENLIIAPEGTDLKGAERILRQTKVEKLPVVNKEGKLIGLITYRDILQVTSYPNAVKDSLGRLLVGAAIGSNQRPARQGGCPAACGRGRGSAGQCPRPFERHHRCIEKRKKNFKKMNVIAGNIATAEGAEALADAGADAVKVGIGPVPFAQRVSLREPACLSSPPSCRPNRRWRKKA